MPWNRLLWELDSPFPKKLLKWRPPFTLKGLALVSGEWIEFLGITWHLWETEKHSTKHEWKEFVVRVQGVNKAKWATGAGLRWEKVTRLFSPPSSLLRPRSQTNSLFRNGNGIYSSCAVFRYKGLMQSPHPNYTILLKSHAHTSSN